MMGRNAQYDFVIVGAGPVGSYIARALAKPGHRVLLAEEHTSIGRPVHCAGLVSPRTLELADVRNKDMIVQNRVKGARIYFPCGESLEFESGEDKALVIDRARFDAEIAAGAIREGAEISFSTKAVGATRHRSTNEPSGRLTVNLIKDGRPFDVECRLLIGADGVQSGVARWCGLYEQPEMLSGYGAELSRIKNADNLVEIIIGKDRAPGFFAWKIPTGPTSARVGLCTSNKVETGGEMPKKMTAASLIPGRKSNNAPGGRANAPASAHIPAKAYFERLLIEQPWGTSLWGYRIDSQSAGGIPLGILKNTYTDNVMLVGDAARQIKPLSGGGIYTGLVCAKHCVRIALQAMGTLNFSKKALAAYQKGWSREIGRELRVGMMFRKRFTAMSDEDFDMFYAATAGERTQNIIAEYGDIDFPSKVGLKLALGNPRILRFLIGV